MTMFWGYFEGGEVVWQSRWRKGWDSNPRGAYTPGGFQDRCLKPIGHPSVATISMALAHIPDRTFFEHRAVCYRFATIFALAKRSVDGCRSSPVASSISIRWAKCVRPPVNATIAMVGKPALHAA